VGASGAPAAVRAMRTRGLRARQAAPPAAGARHAAPAPPPYLPPPPPPRARTHQQLVGRDVVELPEPHGPPARGRGRGGAQLPQPRRAQRRELRVAAAAAAAVIVAAAARAPLPPAAAATLRRPRARVAARVARRRPAAAVAAAAAGLATVTAAAAAAPPPRRRERRGEGSRVARDRGRSDARPRRTAVGRLQRELRAPRRELRRDVAAAAALQRGVKGHRLEVGHERRGRGHRRVARRVERAAVGAAAAGAAARGPRGRRRAAAAVASVVVRHGRGLREGAGRDTGRERDLGQSAPAEGIYVLFGSLRPLRVAGWCRPRPG
jgi:hypothetical protein